MAINLETQYPGKVAPSSPEYPFGQPRNVTAPGAGNGTPWEAAIVSDWVGFFQSLLAEAGIVPTGAPDEVGASQYLDALKKGGVKSTGRLTDFLFASTADLIAGNTIGGESVTLVSGNIVGIRSEIDNRDYIVSTTESDVVLGGGLYAVLISDQGKGFTLINQDVAKAAANLTSLSQNLKVVITGDSLSFNGFDYGAVPSFSGFVNGGAYATDNPFGLMSWAHMIRDMWVSGHGAFTPLQDIERFTDCALVVAAGSATMPFRDVGMNVKALSYYFDATDQSLNLTHNYVGGSRLIVSYAPSAEAVLFEVDGVEYDNESPDGHYQDRGYFMVPCDAVRSEVTNVRLKTGGGPGYLWVYGVTATNSVVPALTGKGAWRSDQILDEYDTLVRPYLPDVVYYIIGANDIGTNSAAQFKQNVSDFIDEVRSDRSDAVIVLISTPPSSSFTKSQVRPYIRAAMELAAEKSCSSIDLWTELEDVDPTYYRFDNIHFKRAGDDLVFQVIKNLTLPGVPLDTNKFLPAREAFIGSGGQAISQANNSEQILVQLTAGAPTITGANQSFSAACTGSYISDGTFASLAEIVLPYGYTLGSATPLYSNSADVEDSVRFRRFSTDLSTCEFFRASGAVVSVIEGSDGFVAITAARRIGVIA